MRSIQWAIAIILLLIAAFFGWRFTKNSDNIDSKKINIVAKNKEPNVLHYTTDAPQLTFLKVETISEGPVPALEPLQGHVTYNEDKTSRITAPIAGRVTKINVQVGDKVKTGQALVTLDSPDFGQANADLKHAESDARLKSLAFQRANTLYEGGVIARKDFESAHADLEQSEIELERARARIKNLGVTLNGSYELRTQLAGVVMDKQINPGSEVRSDGVNTLFVISDPNDLWINLDVPEKDISKIHIGQSLKIEADAYPEESFEAKVNLIGKVLDPNTRRIVVRCEVSNSQEKLKPEMYVRAIPLESSSVLPHVPNSALITQGLQTFLFVENSPGVIEKRRVELGYRGHEQSYISSGIKAGEHVIVGGALMISAEFTEN